MARLAIPAQFRTESNVQAHIDVFLAEGPGEQDAWLIALLRGYVDMNAFLDKAVRLKFRHFGAAGEAVRTGWGGHGLLWAAWAVGDTP